MRFFSLVCFASVRSQFNNIHDDTENEFKNSLQNTQNIESTNDTSENTSENTDENTINPLLLQKRQGKKLFKITRAAVNRNKFASDFHTQQLDALFLQQLSQKIKSDGVNDQVYQTVVKHLEKPIPTADVFSRSFGLQPRASSLCGTGGCNVPIMLQPIWGYGCWCNFGENLMQGRGKPQDEYDQICQSMQMCMRCAVMDSAKYEDNDGYCDPLVDSYNATIQWFGSKDQSLMADCSSDNNYECAAFLCTCELNLINNILGLLWGGRWATKENKHDRGDDPGFDQGKKSF